jgi:hypothetical protein
VPLFSFTTGSALATGAYQTFSSLAVTCTTCTTNCFAISGPHVKLYGVTLTNQEANAGSTALYINAQLASILFCNITATTTATYAVLINSTYNLIDGNSITGGAIGFSANVMSCVVTNNLFIGQGTDSITVSSGELFAIGNTFYNTNGNGINLTSTGTVYAKNNYFEGMPGGKAAINNTSGTNTGSITAVANSYYNVGSTVLGVGDFSLVFDNGVLASSGLTNASGGNFTPTSVLYALGFPGKFLGQTYQSYHDGGAVQHQASGGGYIFQVEA